MRILWIALALAGLVATAVQAEMQDENLLVAVPDGYVEGYSAANSRQAITEWVPQGQTVENWQDMVTVNIVYGGIQGSAADFAGRMLQISAQNCEGAQGQVVNEGVENGYDVIVFVMMCPDSALTHTPEWDLIKVIGGNDSLYVVQKAWTREPQPDEISRWGSYLKSVRVCDSRLPDRACPK